MSGMGYCISAQSGLLITAKHNLLCSGRSLNERNRMSLTPLNSHLFSSHLLKLIIFAISPFFFFWSSNCGIYQQLKIFRRIQRTEKDHPVSLVKNL